MDPPVMIVPNEMDCLVECLALRSKVAVNAEARATVEAWAASFQRFFDIICIINSLFPCCYCCYPRAASVRVGTVRMRAHNQRFDNEETACCNSASRTSGCGVALLQRPARSGCGQSYRTYRFDAGLICGFLTADMVKRRTPRPVRT